ncbi:MAG: TIGR04076 family protein [Candidatus Hodarchaeota archaeon]
MEKRPKCKITVLKRTINRDLIEEYLIDKYHDIDPCERFEEGQEIIIDPNQAKVPEGFCDWAWADLREEIMMIASGGNIMGMKQKGVAITGCSDWFRPVIFKIERIEESESI